MFSLESCIQLGTQINVAHCLISKNDFQESSHFEGSQLANISTRLDKTHSLHFIKPRFIEESRLITDYFVMPNSILIKINSILYIYNYLHWCWFRWQILTFPNTGIAIWSLSEAHQPGLEPYQLQFDLPEWSFHSRASRLHQDLSFSLDSRIRHASLL